MEGLDVERCLEIISDLLSEQGDIIFQNRWDSGAPGAGAGVESVVKWMDLFWLSSSTDGYSGPYDTLEEALETDVTAITSGTTEILAPSFSMEELLSRLSILDSIDAPFLINGKKYRANDTGKIVEA